MTLTKLIIIMLVLQIITYATSFHIHKEVTLKIRRSPANHRPLFGIRPSFQVPSLFSSDQQPLNTFKQFLPPVLYHHKMQEHFRQTIETSSIMNINESGPYNIPFYSSGTSDLHVNKNIGTPNSDILEDPNKGTHSIHFNNNKPENKRVNLDHTTKSTDTLNRNDKSNAANYSSSEETEIDKDSLNSLIKEILQNDILDSATTTEDTTLDYTTGTGDYESTTIDELGLRIPAAAVASLLGR